MEMERGPFTDNIYDDDLPPTPLLEEYPEIAAVLAEPVDFEPIPGGLFDEIADQLETPVEEYVPETEAVEAEYARIFQELAEDEVDSSELEQRIAELEPLDAGELEEVLPGLTSGDSGGQDTVTPSGDLAAAGSIDSGLSSGPTDSGFSLGGAAAGGAAVLAGGMLAAKMASPSKTEGKEPAWYYFYEGQQAGPWPESEIKEKIRLAQISVQGSVWREGLNAWIPINESGLRALDKVSHEQPTMPESNDWYYAVDGETVGPVAKQTLTALISGGKLAADTFVWSEGMEAWQHATAAGLVEQPKAQAKTGNLCQVCGTPMVPGKKFCGNCGAKTELTSAGEAAGSACPHCRAPLKPGARFCGKCGRQI